MSNKQLLYNENASAVAQICTGLYVFHVFCGSARGE